MAGKGWTEVDEIERSMLQIDETDLCYYYLIRTSGGYAKSEANSRIENFKKEPEKYRTRPDVWQYKEREIKRFANDVCNFLDRADVERMLKAFGKVALVPIPTSKPKSDKFYDSRLVDMCSVVASRNRLVRLEDVFDMKKPFTPAHKGGARSLAYLKGAMSFSGFAQAPNLVILVDDVLTSGIHYVACRSIIQQAYPGIQVMGLFLSRHRSIVEYGVEDY